MRQSPDVSSPSSSPPNSPAAIGPANPARHAAGALAVFVAVVIAACSNSPAASPSAASPAPSLPASGAQSGPSGSPSVPPAHLTIFAAASLKAVFTDVKTAYEATHPGTTLTFSFDSSSALEAQIEQGAPADVLASADRKNPQALVDKGLAVGPVAAFAQNVLTIIVPTANPAGVSTPLDLAKDGLKIIAAGDAVPITTYANQLVANLAKLPDYPPDFAARYTANIASKEDNVAAVVAKIELGEGDAAIVYATDARASKKVSTIAVPDAANVPATYGAVAVKASTNAAAAAAFVTWLEGPEGQAVLSGFGFLPSPS